MVYRGIIFLVGLSLLYFVACSDPDAPREKTLQSLLSEHATRSRIEDVIGKDYAWYDKAVPGDWELLQSPAQGDPEVVLKAAKRHSQMMFYRTAWQRTFIFLDGNVMQEYFIAGQ